ncbi:hypothetical protein CDAR_17131 [Caerostris darwini]|uniref:Uncharacterized protein n=1 Tax=Caerostris darwini TaxID=1538125 RepID=A0AAV4N325_9ARAC|nr:hypothetical protein CDAR_17131 [Caerostris darwini]
MSPGINVIDLLFLSCRERWIWALSKPFFREKASGIPSGEIAGLIKYPKQFHGIVEGAREALPFTERIFCLSTNREFRIHPIRHITRD